MRKIPYSKDALFITSSQIRDRYGGVSDTWVDRRLASDARFPRPYFIGWRCYWKIAELEAYERNLARGAGQAA